MRLVLISLLLYFICICWVNRALSKTDLADKFFIRVYSFGSENPNDIYVLAVKDGIPKNGSAIIAEKVQYYSTPSQLWTMDSKNRIHSLSCSQIDFVISPIMPVTVTASGKFLSPYNRVDGPVGLFPFKEDCKYQKFTIENNNILNNGLSKYLVMPSSISTDGKSCPLQLSCDRRRISSNEAILTLEPFTKNFFLIVNPNTGLILRTSSNLASIYLGDLNKKTAELLNCEDALWFEEEPHLIRSVSTGQVLDVSATSKGYLPDGSQDDDSDMALVRLKPFTNSSHRLIWTDDSLGSFCYSIVLPENGLCDEVKATSAVVSPDRKIWRRLYLRDIKNGDVTFPLAHLKKDAEETKSKSLCDTTRKWVQNPDSCKRQVPVADLFKLISGNGDPQEPKDKLNDPSPLVLVNETPVKTDGSNIVYLPQSTLMKSSRCITHRELGA